MITRLGQIGIGVQPLGDFSGKSESAVPVTRLSQMAIGTRRYGSFAGKPLAEDEPLTQARRLFMMLGGYANR